MHVYGYIHFTWEENSMFSSTRSTSYFISGWLHICCLVFHSLCSLIVVKYKLKSGAESFIPGAASESDPHQRGTKQAVFCLYWRLLTLKPYPCGPRLSYLERLTPRMFDISLSHLTFP